jgi:hypothetical protein
MELCWLPHHRVPTATHIVLGWGDGGNMSQQGNYGGQDPYQSGSPGYGQPPGGNWGGPPEGPHGGASSGGFGRLLSKIAIGGVIGGILSSIPLLSILNCCFCVLNLVGVGIGMGLHFKSNPNDKMSVGEAAGFGALTGAAAGLIASVLGILITFVAGAAIIALADTLPRDVGKMVGQSAANGVMTILIYPPVFAVTGALGAVVCLVAIFKSNKAD